MLVSSSGDWELNAAGILLDRWVYLTCTTSAQHSLQMFRKHAVVSASIGFAKHASSPYSHSPCRQPPIGQAYRRDKHHATVN